MTDEELNEYVLEQYEKEKKEKTDLIIEKSNLQKEIQQLKEQLELKESEYQSTLEKLSDRARAYRELEEENKRLKEEERSWRLAVLKSADKRLQTEAENQKMREALEGIIKDNLGVDSNGLHIQPQDLANQILKELENGSL